MRTYVLIASALVLGMGIKGTPAAAGNVCEVDGTSSGAGATAPGTDALACGAGATASGDESTVVGVSSTATGSGAIAIGESVAVSGDNSIGIGVTTSVASNNSLVIDTGGLFEVTTATGDRSIAVGDAVQINSANAVGIGSFVFTDTAGAVAIGNTIQVMNGGSVAVGANSVANGVGTVALGRGATATGANSVALGDGSIADQDNIVSVGSAGNERRVTNVAAGTADTDAVNVGQLNAATAGFASSVNAITNTIADLQLDFDALSSDVRRNRREARRGTAAAVAMSEAPMPSRDGGISYSLHGGAYRGEYALGGSLKYRINRNAAVDVGASFAGHGDSAARVGVSGEF